MQQARPMVWLGVQESSQTNASIFNTDVTYSGSSSVVITEQQQKGAFIQHPKAFKMKYLSTYGPNVREHLKKKQVRLKANPTCILEDKIARWNISKFWL